MEEVRDNDYGEYLSRRLEILTELNANGQYANHVYNTNVEDDEISPQIYLPDVMRDFIEASLTDPEYRTFSGIWQALVPYNYMNYMNGEELDILALATAWLAVGSDVAARKITFLDADGKIIEEIPLPFYNLSLATDGDEKATELFKLVDGQVTPAIQTEFSTNIAFTRINLINAALQFFPGIVSGLKSQKKLEGTLRKIVTDYKTITPLPAYDDMLENGEFVLELLDQEGRMVDLSLGTHLDIFDNFVCSSVVPVCIYNGDELKTGKAIFQSVNNRIIKADCPSGDTLLYLEKRKFFSNARSLCIVVYVYVGENVKDASEAPMSDFAEVIFSFKRGERGYNKFIVTLTEEYITIGFQDERVIDVLIERLNEHLKTYQVAVPEKLADRMISVTQSFVIPSLTLDKELLMFFTTTDPSNSLFKFDEHDTPWSQKKILTFNILLIGNVEMLVNGAVVDHATLLVIDKGKLTALMKGDHIVKIKLSAHNVEQYNIARYVILRYLANYVKNYQSNYEIYNRMFSRKRVAPIVPLADVTGEDGQGGVSLRNIKHLRVVDPVLWTGCNYTRVAASNVNQQVKPINANEVDKYKRNGRMVIQWPVEVHGLPSDKQTRPSIDPKSGKDIRVFYTTFSSENPYIALIPNKGPNSDTHPYIPKCQKTSSGLVVNPDWTLTIVEKEKNTTRSNKKTLHLLSPGESGTVNGSLNFYIGHGNAVFRYGVLRSKSSFLHCVLFATSAPGDEYMSIHTFPSAEKLVTDMRMLLVPFASACMQENPGKTVEEIADAIADPEVYLDPSLYYRACEERFGVNIFIAGPNENKELLLQAPNFGDFYARTKRRPLSGSMVVIKLPIPHIKDSTIFQCEVLFVAQDRGGSLFTEQITRQLEEATIKIAQSLKVTPKCVIRELPDGRVSADQMITMEESSLGFELPPTFLSKLNAMYVDSRGKCRGIRVSLKDGSSVWLVTPPIEPLSGPNVGDDETQFEAVEKSLDVTDIEALDADKRVQAITELSQDGKIYFVPQDKQLVGVWFNIFGLDVYLPLKPSPWLQTYTPIKYTVAFNSILTESPTMKLQRLQRVVTVSIQIMKRLFILSGLKGEDFVSNHMVLTTPKQPMTTMGGSRLIPSPAMSDFKLLLDHFIKQFPSLFQNRKLLCDTEAYLTNMTHRLLNFEQIVELERRTQVIPTQPEGNTDRLTKFPRHLDWFYVCYDDFAVQSKNQIIFMSTDRLHLELAAQKQSNLRVVKRIEPSMVSHHEPYVFFFNSKQFKAAFLIQNVESGDVSKAATVASYWVQNRVNLGYYAPPIVPEANATIVNVQGMEISDPFGPIVIRYQSGEYAALLSLNEK